MSVSVKRNAISITKNANNFGVRSEIVVTRNRTFLSEMIELLGLRSHKETITEKEAFVFISRKDFQRSPEKRL